MNRQKILSLLGLAMKAQKLVTGEAFVIQEIRKQKASLVFIAADASVTTKKKIKEKCSYYNIPWNETFSQEELSQSIGKTRKIIGVNDAGFAKKLNELIEE